MRDAAQSMNVPNGIRKDDNGTCSPARQPLSTSITQIDRKLKSLRLCNFILAGLVTANLAHADVVQVPVLANGSVDLEKVLDGFELAFPVNSNGVQSNGFTGEMLGGGFSGRVIEGDTAHKFVLAIDAPTHSEHGHFLVAVLATETICLRNALAPGLVLWQETKIRNGTTWEVSASCSTPTN